MGLVDSGVSHCFVSEMLVAKFALPVLPGDGMQVMLAERSQVEASKTLFGALGCLFSTLAGF